jgi:hypothetical protein
LPEDVKAKAEKATGRAMTQEEVSRYYFRETLNYIRSHPVRWLRLLGKKLMLYFGPGFNDLPAAFFYIQSCTVLKILFLPFAVIAPLGLCGFGILVRRRRYRGVFSIFFICGLVSVLLFFVNARYRLPTVPVFIILAALFFDWAWGEIKRKQPGPLVLLLTLTAVFILFVSTRPGEQMSESAVYGTLGFYHLNRNEDAKAASAFAKSYRSDPDNTVAAINFANLLTRQGQYQEAADIFARVYAQAPRYPLLAIEYGMVLVHLDRRDEAKKLFLQETTSKIPRDRALACRLLAEAEMTDGNKNEAIVWLKRALEVFPGEPELTEMLNRFEAAPQ